MAKMLEMIQQSAVPVNLMRSAARGALALPASETLEILVYLTTHPLFGQEARMTLAQWDPTSAVHVLADPNAPPTVIAYFLNPKNWRLPLLPTLVENPAVDEQKLMDLAGAATPEVAALMLASSRVLGMKWVLKQLFANPKIAGSAQYTDLMRLIPPQDRTEAATDEHHSHPVHPPHQHLGLDDDSEEADLALKEFREKHAHDIAAEEGKKFELVKADGDEPDELAALVEEVEKKPAEAPKPEAPKPATPVKKEPERLSVIQKINRLTVGERVQLAVKGSKDERFVLIRDGSKVVSLAVLESPKLSESEAEAFAAMKNVQQTVLRAIAGKRKFMKQYSVVRALANNPRLPLDIGLTLMPHLLSNDLLALSKNKNVSDTLRKIALKLYKDKNESRKG